LVAGYWRRIDFAKTVLDRINMIYRIKIRYKAAIRSWRTARFFKILFILLILSNYYSSESPISDLSFSITVFRGSGAGCQDRKQKELSVGWLRKTESLPLNSFPITLNSY